MDRKCVQFRTLHLKNMKQQNSDQNIQWKLEQEQSPQQVGEMSVMAASVRV